jgi:hypothetical protein
MMKKAAIVQSNRKVAADGTMKGMQASNNPPPLKPLGPTPAAPSKKTSTGGKGPAAGGSVKLGGHYSNK